MRIAAIVVFPLSLLMAGCSLETTAPLTLVAVAALGGKVFGGQQPIVGSHVYLLAANTTGYGNASVSLLSSASTGQSDSVGAYVLSDANGFFSISGDYSCTSGTQVYLYALGGNPGAGSNSAAGLMAILGQCPAAGNFRAATPFIAVNEVSTVAAAYAFAGFATDATHVSSSGTTAAQLGIANAFASAASLADLGSGGALLLTPGGNGVVPQSLINTLGNIVAACVNSSGPSSSPCSTLFSSAKSSGSTGTTATDTATVAINIAHNPGSNVAALFGVVSPNPPFLPALILQPSDLAIVLSFTGGGVLLPSGIAADASGNIWVANTGGSVSELSNSGSALSGLLGYIGGGLSVPGPIAIDRSGNAWVANYGNASLSKFSSSGTALSPSTGFTGGGLSLPISIAVDGLGNVWASNTLAGISKISNTGTALSPALGYTDNGLTGRNFTGIAISPAEDAWIVTSGTSDELVSLSNSGVTLSPGFGYTGTDNATADAVDSSGNIWMCSSSTLKKESATGSSLISASLSAVSGCSGTSTNALAIDGAGTAWIAGTGLYALTNSGTVRFSDNGFLSGGGIAIALDASGNVWTTSSLAVLKYVGLSIPVVTPLAEGVGSNMLGTRP